ncbi:MAG: hypothetical protein ACTH5N_00230 [Psychroflexus halocasei]|uniref:hypothetical protein n=1 Tax=Psychroflexus sp. S27 TaxID=1982757 RepID=UPI000C29F9E9|nr:hypothetical protein [Psychroflexus sp. S27]PJX21960.1 hypothetical protein CAP47_10120 [Psychroflexus sp. S27]
MNFKIEQNLKKLEQLSKHYKKQPYFHKNQIAEDADKLWNASLFFANLLLKSNYSEPEISETELNKFAKAYEKHNKESVDLKALFSKFWLRNIFGSIYIPSVVRKTASDYEDKNEKYNELLFIRYLTENLKITKTPSNELDEYIKIYQSTHNVILDSEWLYEAKYFKETKEDAVFKINGVDYYKKLLDNWTVFKFINELRKHKDKHYKKKVLVKKVDFDNILIQHKSIYPKVPETDELIENEVITQSFNGYILSLRSANPNYLFDLADRIKAIIWQKLLDDNNFKNDEQRILNFLSYSKFDEHRHDIVPHLSAEAKKRFQETALEMVLKEPDLNILNQEFDKVLLEDDITSRSYWNNNIEQPENSLKQTDDVYDLYKQMIKVSDNFNGNLFFKQRSRTDLSYLVDELLNLDAKYSNNNDSQNFNYPHYPITKQLLFEGLQKPYLLWKSAYFLRNRGLTRLPFLLIEEKFATLSFRLLDNASIEVLPDETVSQVRTKMLKIAIQLVFDQINSSHSHDKDKFTNIVFQLFKEINRDKFQLVRNSRTIEIYDQTIADKKERENILLQTVEDYTQDVNSFSNRTKPAIISKHLLLLLEHVHTYLPVRELSNGSWHLPLQKLDYLSWLSEVVVKCQLKNEKIDSNIEQKIAKLFLDIYLSAIEKTSITKTDYPSLESKDTIPSWYLDNEHLDNINWIYPLIVLNRNNLFSKFINPTITFNSDENIYDDFNQYSARRLRSHLFILLSTQSFINNRSSNLFRLQKETTNIKNKLEASIVEILRENAVQHNKNRIDILDEFFERSYKSSNKSELILQIANSINWFSDKKEIINVLTKTSDLTRLLIIVDWITAEGLKKELIKKIKKSKITEFIKSRRWNPEIELIIRKLTYHPKLVEQTKEALDYWKKNATAHSKKDLEKVSYLVALMLAYNNKDENALDATKIPEHKSYKVHKEFDVDSYKQFFRALIRFETNAKSAYQIFDNLHHQFPKHSTIALNRFAAKVNWASKSKDNTLFEEALDEWKTMEMSLPESYVEPIKDKIWTNQLTAYYHLENKHEFDKLYLSIPFPYNMKEDIVELRIGILLKFQLREEAKKVLFRATEYHKDSDAKIPKFVRKLKTKLDDKTDIKFLQNNFNEIFAAAPRTLIQIFPDRLNAENSLGNFITKEVALASSKMLDKINAIREVGHEDKYNDLIQLALEARMAQWGWLIQGQDRGGFSENKDKYNPGERDIMICDGNGEPLIVCEAFIWSDKRKAESHIKKIFNYYHKRKNFIMLIYDKRQHKNFDSSWKKYKENVLPNLSYQSGFGLKKSKWKELTKRFDYQSSAIKVGSSNHGKGKKIFHIMVNLNYRVK